MKSSPLFSGASPSPPADDELEISVFGPGRGESVVVHLGWGNWIVVDSCCPVGSSEPIALSYLDHLGVAQDSVRLVVATHWHSDHIGGIARVLDACRRAEFVCSNALGSDEFVKLITKLDQRPMIASSGADEFHRVLTLLKRRATSSRSVSWKWAAEGKVLYENHRGSIEVRALAPSDVSFTQAMREIAQLVPKEGANKGRAIARTPNQNAVVIWIRSEGVAALLGADLECSTNPRTGWAAVLNAASQLAVRAEVFKVPHHGSGNADDPRVWSQMLEENPIAALTQFAAGAKPLPSADDVRRLAARTDQLYCTGPADGWAPKRKKPAVEKTLREVARKRRAITGPMGHIQIRVPLSGKGNPVVLLSNGARNLAA